MGRRKERTVWIITSLGLTLGSYLFAYATYLIKPFWVKGSESTVMTILFLIFFMIAISLTLNFVLFNKLEHVDKRVRYPWLYTEENGLYKFMRDIHKGLDRRVRRFERRR